MTNFSTMHPKEARLLFRNGLARPSSGMCYGYLQASLKSIPKKYAFDFLLFCQRNPVPEPVLEVLEPGIYETRILADKADVRTDLPRYRVFENGKVKDIVTDVKSYWRDDLVTFIMGGSITFEGSLVKAGIPMRHIDENVAVPMYITNIMTNPAGPFFGGVGVSMRPIKRNKLPRAVAVTAKVPNAHGSPIWIGNPEEIGIKDINKPDFGHAVTIEEDDVPVFWGCGVTSIIAAQNAKIDFMITQDPGYVFIADVREEQLDYINTPGFIAGF
jgi:uncharacterized protein YcsI (UPF0317 family)